jgi:internalin A
MLSELKNLKALTLEGNQLSDISALSKLENLVDLSLAGNNIEDVSCLSNLKNLRYLRVSSNPIPQEQVDALKIALPACDIYF